MKHRTSGLYVLTASTENLLVVCGFTDALVKQSLMTLKHIAEIFTIAYMLIIEIHVTMSTR